MSLEDERAFADEIGRHYARQYGLPPMVGRVAGWLMVCEPPQQTAADIADALHASRSAVGNAIAMLENQAFVRRSRAAGQRVDHVELNPAYGEQGLDSPAEWAALVALTRRGLDVLAGAPLERRARLLEMQAFAQFLHERMPAVAAEWRERRAAMRASGELPS